MASKTLKEMAVEFLTANGRPRPACRGARKENCTEVCRDEIGGHEDTGDGYHLTCAEASDDPAR